VTDFYTELPPSKGLHLPHKHKTKTKLQLCNTFPIALVVRNVRCLIWFWVLVVVLLGFLEDFFVAFLQSFDKYLLELDEHFSD